MAEIPDLISSNTAAVVGRFSRSDAGIAAHLARRP